MRWTLLLGLLAGCSTTVSEHPSAWLRIDRAKAVLEIPCVLEPSQAPPRLHHRDRHGWHAIPEAERVVPVDAETVLVVADPAFLLRVDGTRLPLAMGEPRRLVVVDGAVFGVESTACQAVVHRVRVSEGRRVDQAETIFLGDDCGEPRFALLGTHRGHMVLHVNHGRDRTRLWLIAPGASRVVDEQSADRDPAGWARYLWPDLHPVVAPIWL
jgi:hypothetical protein